MCGIAGKVDFAGVGDLPLVARMCRAMEHRGPNARGLWTEGPAALGMQRLSIIDIAGGDQPIFNEDGTVAVVMNGEIYNFQDLRQTLITRGHRFATLADTEVLVHLYEEMGERLVDELRGMFAFAIWDTRRQELLLGRDRVGKKPLFIARRGSRFWFASELMALLQDREVDRTPDLQAIAQYLALQYVPHPRTAFGSIQKLPPATTLRVSAQAENSRRYWQLDYSDAVPIPDPREAAEEVRRLLWEATRIRLMSEVPLGAFLSGGIDSSAVVAAMADQTTEPVKTFSIGFRDENFDELQFARLTAREFSTEHSEFIVEPQAVDIMPRLARHYGEPFADPAALPTFYLSEMTARHVTVALNGDGGDECFAGYARYTQNKRLAAANHLPRILRSAPAACMPKSAPPKMRRIADVLGMDEGRRYAHWMSAFRERDRHAVLQAEFLAEVKSRPSDDPVLQAWSRTDAPSFIERMLATDSETYLPADLLTKVDIATMAYSLEGRSPFLDHELLEYTASLPVTYKMRRANGKLVLKSALREIVPDVILDRPKMGFGVPLCRWFREDLKYLPAERLLGEDSRVSAYVTHGAIRRLITEHQARVADHSLKLWVLLQLDSWHREVAESPIQAGSRDDVITNRAGAVGNDD